MSDDPAKVEQQRQMIREASDQGTGSKLWAYTRLSGPGWLQSAITLGGGSLSGSLYLGILAGFSLMWLQPLAMIMGVIMLSAIGYVALSTKERPFLAVRRHVNPALGWGWAIATMMANLVWCMPQFALGSAALEQNLAPEFFDGFSSQNAKDFIAVICLFVPATIVVFFYDSGGWGIRLFEIILKIMVGVVVLSFFGVVFKMATSSAGLEWGQILGGFIPDPRVLFEPSPLFAKALKQSADAEYWRGLIMNDQRDVMITAAATAVGINMTFLLPYSMLQRGWDRDFRGLAMFDLATGLFIPFMLATSCVVIASASQFHGKPAPGLLETTDAAGSKIEPSKSILGGYHGLLDNYLSQKMGKEEFGLLKKEQKTFQENEANEGQPGPLDLKRKAIPKEERQLAAMLVKRDAFDLSNALAPLFDGEESETVASEAFPEDAPATKPSRSFGQYLFGIGVLGMAVSTIIILMLINGFVVCEMLGLPSRGWPHRLGCLMAGLTGALGPFIWRGDAKFWLAVPTSVFGMILLPIAYITFFCLLNSKSLLGEHRPRGRKRVQWNLAMGVAVALASFGSGWSLWSKLKGADWSWASNTGKQKWILVSLLTVFLISIVITHFTRTPMEKQGKD